tara:strand:+ start:810 stop:2828 length:2019 start_codon:yes stop_codon:yes gene_type:complete
MDRSDKPIEYAPKGMFPEDDEDVYDLSGDLDVWGRDSSSGYTWNKPATTWWSTGGTTSWSGMWGGGFHTSTGDADAIRLNRHKNHLDSLCKVVDPTVKHTLDFGTASTGYTDMTTGRIVIDGGLLKKSDKNLDITCGLAIHEKLHVVHSKPLHDWMMSKTRNMTYGEKQLFHSITNIVEDEYIERQLSITCPGYVHYIEKVKEHYFNDKSKALEEGDSKFGDLINTLLLLVRYPALLTDERKKNHSPHIRYFMSELKDGLESRDSTYGCITGLYVYLKQQWEDMSEGEDPEAEAEGKAKELAEETLSKIMEDYKELDIEPPTEKLEKMRKSLFEDEFSRLMREHARGGDRRLEREVLDSEATELSDYKSMRDELSHRMVEKIKELAETDYKEINIDKSIAISPKQRKVGWQRYLPTARDAERYKEEANHMKAQITKLKRKIDLFGNTQHLQLRNQKRGRLDKRNLHRIPMGREDLFKATIINEDKPLDVCLLVDESGSMGSYTMSKARQSAIAIKEALVDNPMLDLWVFGHTADETENGKTDMYEYWGPNMTDRPMAMGGLRAKYENRDGNAILASCDRVKSESTTPQAQKLLIMLSDGEPSAQNYRGDIAYSHTRKCVKYAESRGWTVIQVGFAGARKYSMEKMFNNWVYIEDTDKLGDEISKIIRKVIKV